MGRQHNADAQVFTSLGDAEFMMGRGMPKVWVLEQMEISGRTYFWWRMAYWYLRVGDVDQLKALERESRPWQHIVSDQSVAITLPKKGFE
jgi:hypothetical protein